jgi:two-component system, NtrC family, sensor histidine kinase HydH
MEQRVISEFEKYKSFIENSLKRRFGEKLLAEDISAVIDILGASLMDMIKLMREGKSAHEKFFSDIILNSIDAIIGIDNEFKVFLWNKGAEQIFGYKKEEMMAKDFASLIPPERLKNGEREFLINEVLEKGFLANFESERLTKDGKLINVSITRFEIYDEKKEPIGSVGIVRDITKVKHLERELRERENLALIGEVVSSIAHSLSNPLNIISGNADYLLIDKTENDKEYEELKTILDEATRITKSIRHLLNFSRPLRIEKKFSNINSIINEVVKNSKYIAGDKKITFKKSLKEIPEFKFDRAQIQEVLSNIIANAIQAITDEGEIKIKTSLKNNCAETEISDNGGGIPKENLEKIFKPFFSSKGYGKGTGLGLSIARRILREHNGDITVKSLTGKGSTFTITLPLS